MSDAVRRVQLATKFKNRTLGSFARRKSKE